MTTDCQENSEIFTKYILIAIYNKGRGRYILVIISANIVEVTRGKIIENRFFVISSDTILIIDDTKKIKNYKSIRYVDAAGKYVIPGLWDMYIHFRGRKSFANANKAILPY